MVQHDERVEVPAGLPGLAVERQHVQEQVAVAFALRDGQVHFIGLAVVLGLEAIADRSGQVFLPNRDVRQKTAHHVEVRQNLYIRVGERIETERLQFVGGGLARDDLIERRLGIGKSLPR